MSDSAAIKGLGSYLTSSFREFAISRGLTQEIINDYAALKAERDALAAENAAMKELAKDYANLADSRLSDITANCESDCRRECYEACNKTPATDAFLNSVRAEGADAAAVKIRKVTSIFKDIHHGAVNECADISEMVAAQLRAGKDGE